VHGAEREKIVTWRGARVEKVRMQVPVCSEMWLRFNIGGVLQLTASHLAVEVRDHLGSDRESPALHSTLRSCPIVQ